MPIRPSFAVPPTASMPVAFATGRGQREADRDRFRLQQQQLAEQARQFNTGLKADLYSQQQGQQFDLARMRQQAMLNSLLNQQDLRNRMALNQQGFSFDQRLQQMRDDALSTRYAQRDAQEWMMEAQQRRNQVEMFVGGVSDRGEQLYDVSNLNPAGVALRESISSDLAKLDEQLASNSLRPSHYAAALNQLMAKARTLAGQHYQKEPAKSMPERWHDDRVIDHELGMLVYPDGRGSWRLEPISKPGMFTDSPGTAPKPEVMGGAIRIPTGEEGKYKIVTSEDILDAITNEANELASNNVAPWQLAQDEYERKLEEWNVALEGAKATGFSGSIGAAPVKPDAYAIYQQWRQQEFQKRWNRLVAGQEQAQPQGHPPDMNTPLPGGAQQPLIPPEAPAQASLSPAQAMIAELDTIVETNRAQLPDSQRSEITVGLPDGLTKDQAVSFLVALQDKYATGDAPIPPEVISVMRSLEKMLRQ